MELVQSKLIGKGSYGSVYMGVRQPDGLRCAIKTASKDSVASIQALENEISTLRLLSSTKSSPFIVEYYGDDETTTHRSLHLEYLPCGDVAKSGGVCGDVELIRSYTWCLVMGLKDVHSKGVVHCDVKGSNVLVGSTKGVVKLCDFGSSMRIIDSDFDQTVKVVPRGSPLWMAPEVVRGEAQGFESDVWSLGCTVIEMLTGLPAWRDIGPATLFEIGYSDKLPEYPDWLTDDCKDFLNKCLVRNLGDRWSCDQLLEHPFLVPVPASLINEASPRSIFDWQSLEFSDDDDEYGNHVDRHDDEIMERIGKLATTSGVNWESHGWVDVRSVGKVKEDEVSAGTSRGYSEFEVGESTRAIWEFREDDYPTWNILIQEYDSIDDQEHDDDKSVINGGDGVHRCSCGGVISAENIQTSLSMDEVLLYSSFVLFFVLYSFTSNNRNFIYIWITNKYYHLIYFLWSHMPSWNVGASYTGSLITKSNTV